MKDYNFKKLVRKLRKKEADGHSVFPRANDPVENREESAPDRAEPEAEPDFWVKMTLANQRSSRPSITRWAPTFRS